MQVRSLFPLGVFPQQRRCLGNKRESASSLIHEAVTQRKGKDFLPSH